MNTRVGVVLTSFRRPETLDPQILAVRNQTIQFHELVIWHNGDNDYQQSNIINNGYGAENESFINCSKNWGVWPRFAMAMFMDVDYIAVFDDDTIPGSKWFENCLSVMRQSGPAVLGSCGVAFLDGERGKTAVAGWKRPCPHAVYVDIVGHAWFFPRGLLRNIGHAPFMGRPTCGEDYWLSVEAQAIGMPTICPPHPPDDKEMWGSIDGMNLGDDEHALWRQPVECENKSRAHQLYVDMGWSPNALHIAPEAEE